LTIVGGKGGVGKTSVACAVAIDAAARKRVLLVSTDPAPSIADALDQPIGDAETAVVGADGLVARQMDAEAAFERLRGDYRERVDALFDGLIAKGVDAAHDRAVMRELLALAPPGIDELYALAALGETLAEARFDIIIIDPAPTGHLLRLLELPATALDWSRRLMRMMLKYREVVGLGETAAELLEFAKRTRGVAELLRDHARCGALVVTLDEPLVRVETSRLIDALTARGVAILGVLWNRIQEGRRPLSLPRDAPQLVCMEARPAPIGVDALRWWRTGWSRLERTDG
jgi:arsenite-transporting ATPase